MTLRFTTLSLTRIALVGTLFASAAAPMAMAAEKQVVVYSSRKAQLIDPIFDAYTKATGVKVVSYQGGAGPLVEKIRLEGKLSPADVLLTVDGGNLWNAANKGLFQPIASDVLTKNVPENLKDPKNLWFGLSKRARTIVYSTERVKPADIKTYENLASSEWKGRLCLRTSKKVYNQSLVAMMIHELGESKAEQVVKGWVKNLAIAPTSNDTKLMEAILAGKCDLGIVNTYYYGRLAKKKPAMKLGLYWPNQDSSGVHVNVSGAGVLKHAKHAKEAQKLIEWLSSPVAQKMLADSNNEYPVNESISPAANVAKWGAFRENAMNISETGKRQAAAIKLMDRAGYK